LLRPSELCTPESIKKKEGRKRRDVTINVLRVMPPLLLLGNTCNKTSNGKFLLITKSVVLTCVFRIVVKKPKIINIFKIFVKVLLCPAVSENNV